MRRGVANHPAILLAVATIAAAVVLPAAFGQRAASREKGQAREWREREVARVQDHLAGAELIIASATTEHLSAEQRTARERNVELLRGYRARATFSRNVDSPHESIPYFVDDRGVPCAMAYLIACSGRNDIVDRVHATRNNARIKDLATDADLVVWLDDAGLTVAEAARIQPGYRYDEDPSSISAEYAIASAAASLANAAAIAWTLSGDQNTSARRWRGALGTAVAGFSIGLGVVKLDNEGDVQSLGIWNTAVGGLSLLIGAHALFGPSDTQERGSVIGSADESREAALSFAPMFGSAPGLQLALSF